MVARASDFAGGFCLDMQTGEKKKPGKGNKSAPGVRARAASVAAVARPRVVVVMPAYNAAKTVEKTHGDIPKEVVSKIILVDDASQDETATISRQLGLDVIVHLQNKGYGGNQKTCYIEALSAGADIVIMLHPDNQYDATRIPEMIQPIIDGKADLVLGSRLLGGRSETLQGGMPIWKYISNRFLTTVENMALGTHLSEAAHRLSGIFSQAAAHYPVPAQLGRLRI